MYMKMTLLSASVFARQAPQSASTVRLASSLLWVPLRGRTLLPLLRRRRILLPLHAPTAGQSWNQHAFAFTLRLWIGRVLASAASTSVETWPTPPTKRSKTSCGAWRACRHGSASTTGRPRGRGGHREGRRFHIQTGTLNNPTIIWGDKIVGVWGFMEIGGMMIPVTVCILTSAKSLR